MDKLPCPRCKTPLAALPASSPQPLDVRVACANAACGWSGQGYQAVPNHKLMAYSDERKKRPCDRCGQDRLSWHLEPVGKVGYVSCQTQGCGFWAEVF